MKWFPILFQQISFHLYIQYPFFISVPLSPFDIPKGINKSKSMDYLGIWICFQDCLSLWLNMYLLWNKVDAEDSRLNDIAIIKVVEPFEEVAHFGELLPKHSDLMFSKCILQINLKISPHIKPFHDVPHYSVSFCVILCCPVSFCVILCHSL